MPAAIPNRVSTQIRINETVYKKLKIIAKQENRNANSQIEYFIKKGVAQYEAENGAISVPDDL